MARPPAPRDGPVVVIPPGRFRPCRGRSAVVARSRRDRGAVRVGLAARPSHAAALPAARRPGPRARAGHQRRGGRAAALPVPGGDGAGGQRDGRPTCSPPWTARGWRTSRRTARSGLTTPCSRPPARRRAADRARLRAPGPGAVPAVLSGCDSGVAAPVGRRRAAGPGQQPGAARHGRNRGQRRPRQRRRRGAAHAGPARGSATRCHAPQALLAARQAAGDDPLAEATAHSFLALGA